MAGGHFPAPSQVADCVWVPPAQVSCRQPVLLDHGRQAPEPLQVPSLEQSPPLAALRVHRDLGSTPPLSTLAQVPSGLVWVPLQVLHRPSVVASAQAVLQQRPSVQKPLAHWLPAVQAAPVNFRPQELSTQVLGGTQSAASVAFVQLALHAPAVQANAPQEWVGGVRQAPFPSQVEAGLVDAEVTQTAGAQRSPWS